MTFWHTPISYALPHKTSGLEGPLDKVFWHTSGLESMWVKFPTFRETTKGYGLGGELPGYPSEDTGAIPRNLSRCRTSQESRLRDRRLAMTASYDTKTERWIVTDEIFGITVKGPAREGCEERVLDLARRFQELRAQTRKE